ncbi:hypothetical protein CLV73_1586 [Chryseobacterium geocarposphaerae]|uniref:Uncharacterized protein n=1 Tax=Chryseobacterium geocarposphaerae TaxID=1416776 RepID=A0A2M9C9S0_9FLAO|nr:hypothetical protein CLV73_1586 [Chryseobacterium geocarposphaerae]
MRPLKKHVKIIENLNNFLHIAFGLPILIFFHLKTRCFISKLYVVILQFVINRNKIIHQI